MKRLLAALGVVALVGTAAQCGSEGMTPAAPPATVSVAPSPSITHPVSMAWPAPIARYTPGAVEVCTLPRPKTERDVTAATRRQVLANYRYTGPTDGKHIEIDHRVPFSLCGTNTAANLWVEPADPGTVPKGFNLNSKDRLESYVARKVHGGQMTLAAGQRVFLGDWRIAYCMFLEPATYDACLREVQGK